VQSADERHSGGAERGERVRMARRARRGRRRREREILRAGRTEQRKRARYSLRRILDERTDRHRAAREEASHAGRVVQPLPGDAEFLCKKCATNITESEGKTHSAMAVIICIGSLFTSLKGAMGWFQRQ
jgi:hypothetical protein